MVEVKCYTTSLMLNHALVKIEKELGLDYAEECCKLLHIDYYLSEIKSRSRCYTCDYPSFIEEFIKALKNVRSTEYASLLPNSNLEAYAETLMKYALKISEEDWVVKWSKDVEKYFQSFKHVAKYAHEKICKKFQVELSEPTVVMSAPLPFGMLEAFYDESSDAVVLLTTGFKPSPQLYEMKRFRELDKDAVHQSDSYEGFGLPKKYPELVYLLIHEVAHRCFHHSVPEDVDSYLHGKLLEEEICKALGLEVMLSRTSFDKRLRKKDVYRVFVKELGHYL